MASRTYELTYIINPVISDDHTKNLVRRVNKLVEENGGSVLEVDEWGNNRLSYQIQKKRSGYYVNMYFKAPGELIGQLERTLRIEDNILRFLTLKMDAKMLRHYNKQKKQAEAEAKAKAEAEAQEAEEEAEAEESE